MDYGQPVPERPPSTLPPPGNLAIRLELGSRIGHGRTSDVYEVAIDVSNSSSELASLTFPPMVLKLSRSGRNKAMENEAYFYEEMELLQGIVIPRYYGFFKGEIPPDCVLAGESTASGLEYETDCSHSVSGQGQAGNKQSFDGPRQVCILLIEKLGGTLPVGQRLPVELDIELLEMYSHLSLLGIDHVDIRHANILEAPLCPPGWPGLVSPRTNYGYRYRFIDFDNSLKTDRPMYVFNTYYRQYVHRLLGGLPLGYVIEPWEH
ncbi:hypothetical protein EIP86_006965 [Pleurotus ostreatoroseus]|nr:hypothetical protein EIP86_006965 [Pleurotus ostreatoroseus]